MTNLPKRMLEELQRRNDSSATIRGYLFAVEQSAKHFGKSPDKLGRDELRSYQAYLLTERELAVGIIMVGVALCGSRLFAFSSDASSGTSCPILYLLVVLDATLRAASSMRAATSLGWEM